MGKFWPLTAALLVVSLISATARINSVSTALTQQTTCTVFAESYLTVHIVDDNDKPIQNVTVLLNGTYSCNFAEYRSNLSGTTDSNGDAFFGVVPFAKYNVIVILPGNFLSRSITVTQITAPTPTFHATINMACTPSGRCTVTMPTATPTSEIQTTSITGQTVISPDATPRFLIFVAILTAILGAILVVAKTGKRNRPR